MRIRSVRVGLAFVALSLIAPRSSPVEAQPGAPVKMSEADKKKIAKGYVDAGLAAQNAGDYATALDLYAKAYALVPHPVLLYNEGQAHRLAGHRVEAIAKYRAFLATSPKGDQAATATQWLATLEAEEAKLAADAAAAAARLAEEQRQAEAARQAELARQQEAAAAREAEAQRAREAAGQADAERPPAAGAIDTEGAPPIADRAPRDRGRTLRLAGLATGAVGLAAVGAGIAFGLRARSISDELSMPNAEFSSTKVADGEAADRNMMIAYVAGGALVAGGTTMYLLGRARAHESTRVTVAPRTGGAMVVVAGVLP